MTTIPTSASSLAGTGNRLSELYTTAARSLLAKNPGIKTLDAQIKRDDARLSGLGKLALALDAFHSQAASFSASGPDLAASSSTKAVEARLAGSSAAPGVHTVEVRQIAQGQQLVSKALPSAGTALGSGNATVIKVDMGAGSAATSVSVRIDSSNNTLDGIAKAMRDAGLDAKVVQDGKGQALSVTGKSGAANTLRIGVSGDPVLQGLFSYGPGIDSAMHQKTAAQDAVATIDGKTVTATGNQFDAAIPGLSLSLSAPGKSEVSVARDPSAVAQNVKAFVAAFNTMNGKVTALRGTDADADNTITQLESQLGHVFDGLDAGVLANMGLTRKNGALALDETKLKAAIAADPQSVTQLFAKDGKDLAGMLANRVGQQMAAGGILSEQAAGVQQDMAKLQDKKAQVVENLSRQAGMLVQQYAMAGMGSSLFGSPQANPMSAFDFLA